MKRIRKQNANAGWSLIETLLYGVLLIVVVNAGMRLGISAGRISAINALAKDRLIAVREIDAAFREAVRGAAGVIDSVGQYKASASLVVLSLGEDRARVVGAVTQPGNFGWMELREQDGEWNVVDLRNFTLPLQDLSLRMDPLFPALVSLEYQVVPERGERMPSPVTHQVLAAMHCNPPEASP